MNKITEILQKVAKHSDGHRDPGTYGKPMSQEEKKPWEHSAADKAAQKAHEAEVKRKDTTGGILPKQGYGDFNKDDKIDVRDAVAAHKHINDKVESWKKGKKAMSKAGSLFNKLAGINPDAAIAAASDVGLQGAAAMALEDDKMKTPASGLSGDVIGGNIGNDDPQVGAAQNEMSHDLTQAGQMLDKSKAAYLATRLGIPVGPDARAMMAQSEAPDRIITPLGPDNAKETKNQ